MLTESLNLMTESTRDVGARDGRYKVMCHENTAAGSCQFFDLQKDPLEEYPLPVPAGCADQGSDRPADAGLAFLPAARPDRNGVLSFAGATARGTRGKPGSNRGGMIMRHTKGWMVALALTCSMATTAARAGAAASKITPGHAVATGAGEGPTRAAGQR